MLPGDRSVQNMWITYLPNLLPSTVCWEQTRGGVGTLELKYIVAKLENINYLSPIKCCTHLIDVKWLSSLMLTSDIGVINSQPSGCVNFILCKYSALLSISRTAEYLSVRNLASKQYVSDQTKQNKTA